LNALLRFSIERATTILNDDSQLFGQFQDNEDFRRWLTNWVFSATYQKASGPAEASSRS